MTTRPPLPRPGPLGLIQFAGIDMHSYADTCTADLKRWKSTNALRLEALQGLLEHAQIEAARGTEAIASLESERAANAILTDEIEALRAEIAAIAASLEVP